MIFISYVLISPLELHSTCGTNETKLKYLYLLQFCTISNMENCSFCKIINKERKAFIITENENVIVFLSLENHPLVVPKMHIKDIYGLDEKIGSEIMKELTMTAMLVKKALGSEGIYITQANEKAAGQEVPHIHFHIYPRWEGQPMNQLNKVDDAERELTFNKIVQAL